MFLFHMPAVAGVQKRALDSLGLKLGIVVINCRGCCEPNVGSLKGYQVLLNTEPSL